MKRDYTSDRRLAVLIDADNIPASSVKPMLGEIAKYGTLTFKRIYGDWTRPSLQPWKDVLNAHAITPIQQFAYTLRKNATDSAMIIDAMDILYRENVDGFCLVSSDSDFTRLAIRLREAGKKVFGIGNSHTPTAFRAACDKFIELEILVGQSTAQNGAGKADSNKNGSKDQSGNAKKASTLAKKVEAASTTTVQQLDESLSLLTSSISDLADDSGWAFLGQVGVLLIKKQPDFDPRKYGFRKLARLFKSRPQDFEIEERASEVSPNLKQILVRVKKPKPL